MNDYCKFLGYGYFISHFDIPDLQVRGIMVKDSERIRLVTTTNAIGFAILKLEPAPGVSEDEMFGKITTRAHKVFSKDWPKGLGQDEDGDWPISHCRRYRVAVHDFHSDYLLKAGNEWIPTRLFEDLLLKMHENMLTNIGWR